MRSLKYNLLALVLLVASSFVSHAQSYNMDDIDGTIVNVPTAATVSFYDSGGNGGNYSNNENYTATFRSVNGAPLLFSFTAFQTYNANDYLEIYDGASTAAPLIGRYSGTNSPSTFTPTGEYITFRFVSDNTTAWWQPTVRAGWAATITSMDISAAEIATCSGTFTDKGGGGNYAVNQYYAQTYRSADGKSLRFDFSSFRLDNDREDRLLVYDGADLTAPLIGDYRFNDDPGTVISSNDALTFVFISNNDGSTAAGWSADIECFNIQTFYSYQSGNWDNPACWTTDPSSSTRVNLGETFPKALDKAVIKNGHTIKLPNGGFSVTQLDIQQGSFLDVQGTNNHNFGTIMGKGRLRSTTGDLPEGVYTLFTQAGAGTVELYDQITTSPTLDKTTFNNLEINANPGRTVNIGSTTQINGDLLVKGGILNINSSASSSVTVEGNITVSSGAVFGMGNTGTNQRELIVKGNFENEGTVTFSSNATANYTADPTRGVTLVFNNPTQNQSFVVNGLTTLNKLIVDKGTDDTYMLDVNASNNNNFRLFGRNDAASTNIDDPGNVINNKALEVYAGTLRLGSNIVIPRLLTGGGSTYYTIDQDATVILDGSNVTVTGEDNLSSIVIYGKLSVKGNSVFSSMGAQGIILRAYGVFEIDGDAANPQINTTVFRTSSRLELGTHRGTFIMTGGVMNISGYNYATSHPAFALPFPDNTLQISGGTINVNRATYYGGTTNNESWLVSSNPENISVTGGTVNIYANSQPARINSTAPFYNLVLSSNSNRVVSIEDVSQKMDGVNVVVPAAPRRPLVVLNNLTVNATTTFNPQNENVTVGKNFTLTGAYTPGVNTTTFNAFGIQTFTNGGTINGGGLYDMKLKNGSVLTITNPLIVRNDLEINSQTTLRDGGQTISVAGNITNSGTHESATGGSIILNGTGAQVISGDGLGAFGNLSLNKASGSSTMSANMRINGNLRLGGTAAVLNIGTHKLSLSGTSYIYNALTGTVSAYTGFNSGRMIETAGAQSDFGVERDWSATGSFTYPVGSSGKYRPSIIDIDSPPSTWGSLSINPVDGIHPLATSANSLNYYWNLRREEMTGIPSGNLRLKFYFDDTDVVDGDENLYVPAYYFPVSWTFFNDVNLITNLTNEIRFLDVPDPRGHFTAGETISFGAVTTYYSRVAEGSWEDLATWSYDAAGTLPVAELPQENSPVIIQSGHKINTIDNGHLVGSLTIEANATLDVGTTTGHFFGLVHESTVSGTGTLRISSNTATAKFPGGDFGDFLGEGGGTVEYYTTGTQDFVMPKGSVSTIALLKEGFEGTFPPASWVNRNVDNGGKQWERNTVYRKTGLASAAHIYTDNRNENGYLITPAINMSELATYELTFHRYNFYPTDYVYQGVWISTTTNASGSFSELVELGEGAESWQEFKIDLSSYAGNESVYIAFVYRGRNADNVYIDDVNITKTVGNSRYHNLVINPDAGRTITLPSISVTTTGKVNVKGGGVTATSSAQSATLTVADSLNVTESGTLRVDNGSTFTLEQKGALTIGTNASFLINTAGTAKAHLLNLYGNVENNGTLNLNPGNGKYADIYFKGTTNQTFAGTGTTNLNRVYVDKGTNQTPLVNVTADQFTMNTSTGQALFINNGTIRFSGASLNLTLTTNTTFSIPATGCLSVNGSTVTMGSAADNGADLLLSGKLEVRAGTMNIGAAANNTHNDIEYATAGTPEVAVTGGTLNVNGQIRRSTTIATGNLTYRQTGGDVYIYGKNRDANQIKRALLEVLNTGSFITSGGNLHLVQGVASTQTNNTFGELYLNPATSTVTGGTIVTGTSATGATTNYFNLYLGCPVYSLTVDGTTTAKEARLKTFEATINGNLIIDGPAASILRANGIGISVFGDFISRSGNKFSSFQRSTDSQRVSLLGTNQVVYKDDVYTTVGGALVFGEMYINQDNAGVVTSDRNELIIMGDLFFTRGSVIQSSTSNIKLYKNLYINNGFSHISNDNSRLTFYNSTLSQYIYSDGTGMLGRVVINYNNGVFLDGDIRINNRLDFPSSGGSGKFTIGNSKLTLGSSAIIGTGSNAPGAGRFIVTNGALSDGGVTKEFTSAGGSFTFPIGVGSAGGKYTPATLNVTNTGGVAGTITIKPVDAPHPVCTNAITDELQYFWNVTSTGFSNPTVSHSYTYMDGDIQGNENNYVNARYHNFTWTNNTEILDFAGNRILFTGVNYIDGEYTAGLIDNFGIVRKYYSLKTGNWSVAGNWFLDSPTGPTIATAPPRGNPVFIQTGHTITTNQNGAYAGSVDIASGARLSFGSTTEHNLGHVSGSGTMAFTATGGGSFVFPGGDFSDFMNTTGSTVEYSGAGTLPSGITTYQNVTFLGNNTKKIPAIDILIKGNLRIESGALSNADFNRTLRIEGDWYNAVASGFVPGTGLVVFAGGNEQQLTSLGAGGEQFYNLQINKTVGSTLTLNSNATVNRVLTLTSGVVNTTATNLLTVSYGDVTAVSGGNATAYVNGPLRRMVNNSSNATFPVGKDGRYGNVYIFGTTSSGSQYYTAEYYNTIPTDNLNFAAPLQLISNNEYWRVTGVAGASANLRLRWDNLSAIIPASALDRQKLRVAQYLPPWTKVGETVTDVSQTQGTVETSTPIAFGGVAQNFTLALEQTASAQITSGNLAECNDGSLFPVTFNVAGDDPLSVVIQVNGVNNRTLTNLSEGNHTINFTYAELFAISGAGDYTITISSVKDVNNLSGIVLGSGVVLTLYTTPNPIISGPTSVMTGSSTNFSITAVSGNTYSWSVSALGSIVGSSTGSTIQVDWGAVTGIATITVTQFNTNCSTVATYDVNVRDWPVITGNFNVCANATEVYASKEVAGHVYNWSVVGGTITAGAGTYQISVKWSTQTAGRVTLSQGPTNDLTTVLQDVVINTSPTAVLTIDGSSNICDEETVVLQFGNAQGGVSPTYYLLLDGVEYAPYETLIDPKPNPFTTDPLIWSGATPDKDYVFSLRVTNTTTGCTSAYVTKTVKVWKIPETGPPYHIPNTFGD
ncbi:MAG: hypothetical protein JW783_07660 [Bacteroidales bacterium]|nr:hypothetical protein [Bacteroidales bacterium]MBN2750069.1 hypothetical protein [Bacteroidales bacterium]